MVPIEKSYMGNSIQIGQVKRNLPIARSIDNRFYPIGYRMFHEFIYKYDIHALIYEKVP